MGTKMTIVLDIENMEDFDVNFKDKIHGGTVVAMAKYDAINYTTVVEDVFGNSEWFKCVEALDEIRERTGIET